MRMAHCKNMGIQFRKKSSVYFLFLFLCFVCNQDIALAQYEQVRFQTIGIEHGLSLSGVTSVYQDQTGFLWLGTPDGLNRYDGYEFKVFKQQPGDSHTLTNSYITGIYEDKNQFLWVGTRSGLHRYDPRFDTFTAYGGPTDGTPKILSIYGENWRNVEVVWAVIDGHPLSKFIISEKKFETVDWFLNRDGLIVHSLFRDQNHTLWIGTSQGLFAKRDKEAAPKEVVLPFHNSPEVVSFFQDHQGILWLGTNGHGLVFGDPKLRQFQVFSWKPDKREGFGHYRIQTIYEDREHNLWFGTGGGGVGRIGADRKTLRWFTHKSSTSWSLGQNDVRAINQDRSGIIWFGTFGGGLSRLDPIHAGFGHYSHDPNDPQTLASNLVKSFYKNEKGLWVGTRGGGLMCIDRKNNVVTHYRYHKQQAKSLTHDGVTSLFGDSQGYMWIGTEHGLTMLQGEDLFTSYQHDPNDSNSLAHNHVMWMMEHEKTKNLWIATLGGGISILDPSREKFTHLKHSPRDPRSLSSNEVRQIMIDSKDIIWVSTRNGLNSLDGATMDFRRFQHEPGNPLSLASDDVGCVYEDKKQRMWIATARGLHFFHRETKRFTHYGVKDGFPNAALHGILSDAEDRLWISSNRGLVVFNPETREVMVYGAVDGMQSDEFNNGAYFQAEDGEMFFGGVNGFNAFYPENIIREEHYTPPVVLTTILVNHHLLRPGKNSPLGHALEATQQITLAHDQNTLSLQFAALHYAYPEKNKYAYRMDGVDKDWIHKDARSRWATYRQLSPGKYTFKVMAAGPHGTLQGGERKLVLKILPPLWATWWAIALYVILGLLSVWWFMKAQQRKLEKERMANRHKDEFLAIISHELRTPLNGIIGLTESMIDGVAGPMSPDALQNLGMVASSSKRLAGLVDDILDFSKIRNQGLSLTLRPVDLRSLVSLVFKLAEPLKRVSVILHNDVPKDLSPVLADENRLQQILINLVTNAIKFTEKGFVRVCAQVVDRRIQISVEDSGIGMDTSQKERIFHMFEQLDSPDIRAQGGTGLGLAVVKALVELHGGEISLETTLGEGSTFSFSLAIAGRIATKEMPNPLPPQTMRPAELGQEAEITVPLQPTTPSPEETLSEIDVVPEGDQVFMILVVDDEPVNRQVIVNHLSLRNYRVAQAADGQEALEILDKHHQFDLVLLDIMMPRLSGFDVCRKLRQRYPVNELPVIFLTAKGQIRDLEGAFKAGANDFLTKPISKSELLLRVRTHLMLLDINRSLERKVAERTSDLRQRNDELETLDSIVAAVNSEMDAQRVFSAVLSKGRELFPTSEMGTLLMLDADGLMRSKASFGYNLTQIAHVGLSTQSLLNRYTHNSRRITKNIYIVQPHKNHPMQEKLTEHAMPTPKALLALVIRFSNEIQGFLVFTNYSTSSAFDASDGEKLDRYRRHVISALIRSKDRYELEARNREILQKQSQLLTQEQMASLGTLTAGVAHEIKNPLNFVNNFALISRELVAEIRESISKDDLSQPESLGELREKLQDLACNAEAIYKHGSRADRIVQTMMGLTEGGDNFRGVDINAFVSEYIKLAICGRLDVEMREKLTLEWCLDTKLEQVLLRPNSMGRALVNLTNNALDALQDKCTNESAFEPMIRVSTKLCDDMVEIGIADNGDGVPADIEADIFTPFFTTRVNMHNIGLGLSTCHEIVVREHRGKLRMEPSAPGALFVISIPADMSTQEAPEQRVSTIFPGSE